MAIQMQTLNDEVAVNALTTRKIISSYFKSLFLVSVILVIMIFFVIIINALRNDFLNVNLHQFEFKYAILPIIMSSALSIFIPIAIYIIFSFAQITQAIITKISIQEFKTYSLYLVLATIPLVTILSWYCYDYLIPSAPLTIYDDADTIPFVHGLTIKRYLIMLCIQTCITVFSFTRLKLEISNNKVAKKRLLIAMICITFAISVSVREFFRHPNQIKPLPEKINTP